MLLLLIARSAGDRRAPRAKLGLLMNKEVFLTDYKKLDQYQAKSFMFSFITTVPKNILKSDLKFKKRLKITKL